MNWKGNTEYLRLVLGAQLLFFAGWGGWLIASRNTDSPEFYLETEPVDPRDLFSGTYVALNYEISDPKGGRCPRRTRDLGRLFVKLEDKGKKAVTAAGEVPVYEATDCHANPPQEPGWAKAEMIYRFGGPVATYGIERFYLNENDPRKDARSGTVLAKVKIDRNHNLVLLDLAEKF
jgi:uncharacterized membrane-anchored protein